MYTFIVIQKGQLQIGGITETKSYGIVSGNGCLRIAAQHNLNILDVLTIP